MYFNEELIFKTGGRSNYRIPKLIINKAGKVFVFCNNRIDTVDDAAGFVDLCFAYKPFGESFSEAKTLCSYEGFHCSIDMAIYDEINDNVMVSVNKNPVTRNEFGKFSEKELKEMERLAEEKAKALGIEKGRFIFDTKDGETFSERKFIIEPVKIENLGNIFYCEGSAHGSASGVQLKYGKKKGRLLSASRIGTGICENWADLKIKSFNNSIYSDDFGLTWKTGLPVQAGTGEGTLIERRDGSILYNSRAYFKDGKRYLAESFDEGESYSNFTTDCFLQEEKGIGCCASFLRVDLNDIKDKSLLPKDADGITLFVNPKADRRQNMTVCVSFDSGKTWSTEKRIYEFQCAYSSLGFSCKEQFFYLAYEKGREVIDGTNNPYEKGIAVASFDISWLLS